MGAYPFLRHVGELLKVVKSHKELFLSDKEQRAHDNVVSLDSLSKVNIKASFCQSSEILNMLYERRNASAFRECPLTFCLQRRNIEDYLDEGDLNFRGLDVSKVVTIESLGIRVTSSSSVGLVLIENIQAKPNGRKPFYIFYCSNYQIIINLSSSEHLINFFFSDRSRNLMANLISKDLKEVNLSSILLSQPKSFRGHAALRFARTDAKTSTSSAKCQQLFKQAE